MAGSVSSALSALLILAGCGLAAASALKGILPAGVKGAGGPAPGVDAAFSLTTSASAILLAFTLAASATPIG
jgi:hypothetical protein